MKGRYNRKAKKPTVRRAKRVVAKAAAKAKKSNLDTFAITIRTSGIMQAVQGLTVANYLYTTVPLLSQTLNIGVTNLTEFKLYANMYDQVRVNRVHIKVTPKANFLGLWDTLQDSSVNDSGDGMIHTIIDRDGPGGTSIQNYQKYPSYKKFDQKKGISRTYAVKWPTGVWMDTNNPYENLGLLKSLGCFGGVYMYAENLYELVGQIINNPFADIQVSYDCVFRGKTSGAYVYDSVTGGVMVIANDTVPVLTPTPLLNVRGSLSDQILNRDLSGNLVETPTNDLIDANTD